MIKALGQKAHAINSKFYPMVFETIEVVSDCIIVFQIGGGTHKGGRWRIAMATASTTRPAV
jgi:hypothetical protein